MSVIYLPDAYSIAKNLYIIIFAKRIVFKILTMTPSIDEMPLALVLTVELVPFLTQLPQNPFSCCWFKSNTVRGQQYSTISNSYGSISGARLALTFRGGFSPWTIIPSSK